VNVADLWKFTPLHEAAAKGKYDIVKLLLRHGADPTKKNRDGALPIDLCKDEDVVDLLQGNTALLEAVKKGSLAKVKKLLSPENINCRDTQGRHSTPLHLAAGYNNLEVAEYLLEKGADVHMKDKGGLIALHNASSYGHLDIAALLIKFNTEVNATDKWGFTPLHEAAQKGRTHLCALLLAHGADPFMKNQEGHSPLDLAVAEDVRSLLQDAMTTSQSLPVTTKNISADKINGISSNTVAKTSTLTEPTAASDAAAKGGSVEDSKNASPIAVANETVIMPSGNPFLLPIRSLLSSGGGDGEQPSDHIDDMENRDNSNDERRHEKAKLKAMIEFLCSLGLDHLKEVFEREKICLEILAEMGHDDLKGVGIAAYGHRHLLLKGIDKIRSSMGGGTMLLELPRDDREFLAVEDELQSTIRNHKDNGHAGGTFSRYTIIKVNRIWTHQSRINS